jgi:hypothetical protein
VNLTKKKLRAGRGLRNEWPLRASQMEMEMERAPAAVKLLFSFSFQDNDDPFQTLQAIDAHPFTSGSKDSLNVADVSFFLTLRHHTYFSTFVHVCLSCNCIYLITE